jgi:hypothetical protein
MQLSYNPVPELMHTTAFILMGAYYSCPTTGTYRNWYIRQLSYNPVQELVHTTAFIQIVYIVTSANNWSRPELVHTAAFTQLLRTGAGACTSFHAAISYRNWGMSQLSCNWLIVQLQLLHAQRYIFYTSFFDFLQLVHTHNYAASKRETFDIRFINNNKNRRNPAVSLITV